jgi:hypothetical protein
MAEPYLSERQEKWFATIRANLERETGRTMDEWVAIARACPETAHRARLNWFKAEHGLMQNRASVVISAAFETGMGWNEPDKLIDVLWRDPAARAIFDAVQAVATTLDGVIVGPRKGYTGFSRKVQFAAARPLRAGGALLGLALAADASERLTPRGKSESWSERLTASVPLGAPDEVDGEVGALLKQAWARS